MNHMYIYIYIYICMIIYVYSRGRLLDPSKLMLKSNLPRLAQQTGFLLDLLLACFFGV